LIGLGGLCALALLGFMVGAPLLTSLARFLVVTESPREADLVLVLLGDPHQRPVRASELFHAGLARRVAVSESEVPFAVAVGALPSTADVTVQALISLGVPEDLVEMIPFEGGVTSTRDEALAFRDYVQEHTVTRAIIVSSALQTRRARWIFKRVLADQGVEVQVVGAPYRGFDETNWWKSERGLIAVNNEFIKLVYYRVVY
jgi:uncharacterized SAM-binding protein YcdF (DUF218 family)